MIHWSSRPEVFCKKGVLRNFAKFIWKHLCQSLFFNKVADYNNLSEIWNLKSETSNVLLTDKFLSWIFEIKEIENVHGITLFLYILLFSSVWIQFIFTPFPRMLCYHSLFYQSYCLLDYNYKELRKCFKGLRSLNY